MEVLDHGVFSRIGDGGHQEDIAFLRIYDFGDYSVIRGGTGDGATVPHNDEHLLQLYNGKTGAELASQIYKLICWSSDPHEPFSRVLVRANDNIRVVHQVLMDLEGDETGSMLNGLCFGAFEVKPMWTRVFWAGDAQVFIRFRDGRVWMTENELREHDNEMYALVDRFKGQAAAELNLDLNTKDKAEEYQIQRRMWDYFYGPLCQARDERVNTDHPKGYSLMNGHPEAPSHWQMRKFYTPHIDVIGSVTDGLMQPRDKFAKLSDAGAARRIIESIEQHGLADYADRIEKYERSKSVGHVRHMEKAGVFVRLA